MQAIQTKYLPCTNFRPSRVKAWCGAGSIVLSWDHALNVEENHAKAANALASNLGWVGGNYGALVGGCLPAPCHGYAFVFTRKAN